MKLIVLYDANCSLCKETKNNLKKLDLFHKIEWISLQDFENENSSCSFKPSELRKELHVITSSGSVKRGFYAIRLLMLFLPVTFFFALVCYLPFASFIGNPVYRWIANNRHRLYKKGCESGSCRLE
ncbi:thiol-disulfide oxidoreductase DCC family protein [Bacillus sp. 03113]|uniref:thiol-disulfide oxidoreductase DCC family protein n=1 Tax=Bacillus sp. 03113 TaxID=2578211 RepID=UPI001143CA10|nr:DUF393 domain-containing protein [Bacillus sp. 03113]